MGQSTSRGSKGSKGTVSRAEPGASHNDEQERLQAGALGSYKMDFHEAQHWHLIARMDLFQELSFQRRRCHWMVIQERHPFRIFWTCVVTVLLVYVGTIFLYRLCFIDFHIDTPAEAEIKKRRDHQSRGFFEIHDGWDLFDDIVNLLFVFDLVVNFFFSYKDDNHKEVLDLRQCATHYLQTSFFINFIACIPPEAVMPFVGIVEQGGDYPGNLNSGLRAIRLQRISRLARLIRVSRLAKLTSHGRKTMRWFERHKGARVINLGVGLFWVVHILACGWYLCAALHDDTSNTWVARRVVDTDDLVPLIMAPPGDQWLHSMYFVLTVFTTVGFGDISAKTMGEMVYVCFVMIVGVVVHSMIISEVINVISSNDRINDFVNSKKDLIDAFSDHTELSDSAREEMHTWIYMSAQHWMQEAYSKEDMKDLIVGKFMPRCLLSKVPRALFGGKLVKNRLLTVCKGICHTPPRLPMLLALASVKCQFERGEVVYEAQDYPFNMFLVAHGVFAYVVKTAFGGATAPIAADAAPEEEDANLMEPYMLFPHGTYFGELEIFHGCPRRATVRCESMDGSLLSIQRGDLKELVLEFPEFAAQWRRKSERREVLRCRKLKTMVHGRSYKDLAASVLERHLSLWYQKVKLHRASGTPPSGGPRLGAGALQQASGLQAWARAHKTEQPTGQDLAALDEKLSGKIDALAGQVQSIASILMEMHVAGGGMLTGMLAHNVKV